MLIDTLAPAPPVNEMEPVFVSGVSHESVAVMVWVPPGAKVPEELLRLIHVAAVESENDPDAFPELVTVNACVVAA